MDSEQKIRNTHTDLNVVYRLLDMNIITLTLFICSETMQAHFGERYFLASLVFSAVFFIYAEGAQLYNCSHTYRIAAQCRTISLVWAGACITMLVVDSLYPPLFFFERNIVIAWFITAFFALVLWRVALKSFLIFMHKSGYKVHNAIVVCMTDSGLKLADEIRSHPEFGMVFQGFYDDRSAERLPNDTSISGSVEDALEKARAGDVQDVFITLPLHANKRIEHYLQAFSDTTVNTYIVPDFFSFNLMQSRWRHIGSVQALSVFDTPYNGFSAIAKRCFDVIVSSIAIVILAPVMLWVAFGVKRSSPGPILFKQDRYGLDGQKIKVWKFRSMSTQDNGTVVKQATRNDPRVTEFGAFIRRTSLDELPQFFNVLFGTMSVVGPRPHAVSHNEEYRSIVQRYMLRHKVKPGITGWAQINGFRGETDTLEKMENRVLFDLEYIQRWTVWLDIKIVWLTIFNGFTGEKAY